MDGDVAVVSDDEENKTFIDEENLLEEAKKVCC